jgi:tRNA-Thr(GGU) m(6)t(6)A37 methyltransferase TsaA
MIKEPENIQIVPIGIIKNDFLDEVPLGYEDQISKIIIKPELSKGLFKLDENSHIFVLFWFDRIGKESRDIMKVHPMRRGDIPPVGVFATRSPRRPNPIGVRAVKLVKIEDNTLTVEGLDALNETPVLDIKPYSSKHDLVNDFKSPDWIREIREKEKHKNKG